MRRNFFHTLMAVAFMAFSLPMQAGGVKWLEKCLDAEHLQVTAKNAFDLGFDTEGKCISITGDNLAVQEYKLMMTPATPLQMTNGQTYIVLEASKRIDKRKKMNQLCVNGVNYENKGGDLVGFTRQLSNGHWLVAYSVIDNLGKETDYSLKYRTFLYNNKNYEASRLELYLMPIDGATGDITIYNVGFYTLGDILAEYPELAELGWRYPYSDKAQLENWPTTNNVYINNVKSTTSLEYNYLRTRSLGNMPTSYATLDLRNMNLDEDQTTAIDKDAFEGLSFSKILFKVGQYSLFPTMSNSVLFESCKYTAYKDGVSPADIKTVTDGGRNVIRYSYTRNFKAGNNSCVLPFDVNADDLISLGLTAYTFSSYSDGNISFKEAKDVIAAGTPLMIKAETAGLYLIPAAETPNLLSDISGYKETVDEHGNKFVGSFVKDIPSSYTNCYGLDSKATSFTKMGNTTKTTYYRAFLSLKDAPSESKAITMSFDGNGGTTGISQTKYTKAEDDAYYNLQGIRMNPNHLTHGIYIHNGKKVVIK